MINGDDPVLGKQSLRPNVLIGNISALYPLTQQVHITTSFNTGFRAPNVSDISDFGSSEQWL